METPRETSPEQAAAAAAVRAGVEVAELHDVDHLADASRLFTTLWRAQAEPPAPAHLLRALEHSGNYVAGAFSEGAMVGALVGFCGRLGEEPLLHSHILGVVPESQGREVGFALKLHQRAWCVAHGIPVVEWTFDPLVARNAHFNLTKLGATLVSYLPNFYGAMADAVNAGDETDRALVMWRLDSERAARAARGEPEDVDPDAAREAGAEVILRVGPSDQPVAEGGAEWGPALLCAVPRDIVALRARDPGMARMWRLALRDTLGRAIGQGYEATGASRTGWYLLEKT